MRRSLPWGLILLTALMIAPRGAVADGATTKSDLAVRFERAVRTMTLPNGLTVIVFRRPEVPVFSAVTMVNVGSVDEHVGITGVAHLFEHLAFKGSEEIGVTDSKKEKSIFQEMDALFQKIKRARRADDRTRYAELQAAFEKKQAEASALVVNNEYSVIIQRSGGTGLNASTGFDTTQYFVSFPANRLELWFYLESERFRKPVLRDFYKEKNVVLEERRMRTESNPVGRLIEEALAVAYKAHPYGYPTVGHASDLKTLERGEADAFFREHYVPNNMTIALVGDVDPDQVFAFAKRYFGTLPRGPEATPVETVEPAQQGEKRVTVESSAQPFIAIAYHKPSALDPDEPVWDVISTLLSSGRVSRLYQELVKKQQVAVQAAGFAGFPGNKYPNLFVVFAVPAVGHDAAEVETALLAEIGRLKREPVSAVELARVKTRIRSTMLRTLRSNQGLGMQLATAQTLFRDWRAVYEQVARLDTVTADDVQRVAKATFVRRNRTVATIVKPEEEEAAPAAEPDAKKTGADKADAKKEDQ